LRRELAVHDFDTEANGIGLPKFNQRLKDACRANVDLPGRRS
jgi:hypothetical protein